MHPRNHYRPTSISYQSEEQAYAKVIQDLESKIVSKAPLITETFLIPNRPKPLSKLQYAEELKQQVEEHHKHKEQEKHEKNKPAISERFHGYPNLPQTPRQMRRQKELEKMRYIRESLNLQLRNKSNETAEFRNKTMEYEKMLNNEDFNKLQEENRKKLMKKEAEKEILRKSWDLAVKTKDLQKQLESLERKGISKLTRSYVEVQEEIISEPKQKKSREELRQKVNYLRGKIESKIKQSYEGKIQKIIDQAKQIREFQRNKNSISEIEYRYPSP